MSTDKPTWDAYWAGVGSEDYLAAKALLELSDAVRADASRWLEWHRERHYDEHDNPDGYYDPHPALDWDGWVSDVDTEKRGWSGTEHRLYRIVAALVSSEDRAIPFRRTFGYLGSWETEVWRILTEWGTGGNNKDYPGRATVTAQH